MTNKKTVKQYCQHCNSSNGEEKGYVYIDSLVTKICPKCGHIISPCTFCIENKLRKDDNIPCWKECTADVKSGLSAEEIDKYNKEVSKKSQEAIQERRDQVINAVKRNEE